MYTIPVRVKMYSRYPVLQNRGQRRALSATMYNGVELTEAPGYDSYLNESENNTPRSTKGAMKPWEGQCGETIVKLTSSSCASCIHCAGTRNALPLFNVPQNLQRTRYLGVGNLEICFADQWSV